MLLEPIFDDPLNSLVAQCYKQDKDEFKRRVQEAYEKQ